MTTEEKVNQCYEEVGMSPRARDTYALTIAIHEAKKEERERILQFNKDDLAKFCEENHYTHTTRLENLIFALLEFQKNNKSLDELKERHLSTLPKAKETNSRKPQSAKEVKQNARRL